MRRGEDEAAVQPGRAHPVAPGGQDTAVVRHVYPWVPTDQAHDRPRQVGPAY
jgi:hypothetical protein